MTWSSPTTCHGSRATWSPGRTALRRFAGFGAVQSSSAACCSCSRPMAFEDAQAMTAVPCCRPTSTGPQRLPTPTGPTAMEVRTRCDPITSVKFLHHTLRHQSAAGAPKTSNLALRGSLLTFEVCFVFPLQTRCCFRSSGGGCTWTSRPATGQWRMSAPAAPTAGFRGTRAQVPPTHRI